MIAIWMKDLFGLWYLQIFCHQTCSREKKPTATSSLAGKHEHGWKEGPGILSDLRWIFPELSGLWWAYMSHGWSFFPYQFLTKGWCVTRRWGYVLYIIVIVSIYVYTGIAHTWSKILPHEKRGDVFLSSRIAIVLSWWYFKLGWKNKHIVVRLHVMIRILVGGSSCHCITGKLASTIKGCYRTWPLKIMNLIYSLVSADGAVVLKGRLCCIWILWNLQLL